MIPPLGRMIRPGLVLVVCAMGAAANQGVSPVRPVAIQVVEKQAGDQIVLTSEEPVGWLAGDRPVLTSQDGRTCYAWTGPPGRFTISAVSIENNIVRQTAIYTIVVRGAGPVPDPTPDPFPPTPDDVIPDHVKNEYGVGHLTYRASKGINDKAMASRLSRDVFIAAADRLKAAQDTQSVQREVRAWIAKSLNDTIGTDSRWDAWRAQLSDAMNASQERSGGWNNKDLEAVCREIGLALIASV